jgi:CPA2 family monovalent cation:H+ antiporter-2
VEDLAVIVLTVLLPSLAASNAVSYTHVLWKIGKAFLFLVPFVFAAWKVMPRLMARVQRMCNDEISLLFGLTVCLVVAALTEAIGLSLALGAFVGGMSLGSSEFAHKLAAQNLPIRDAFVALFFASVGMLIDPHTWITHWRLVAVLVAIVLIGKFVVWFLIVRLFGYPTRTALTVGIGLAQIGEFSFILAQVALHSQLIRADVYNGILAASLLTILINAALFKLVSTEPGPGASPARATIAG